MSESEIKLWLVQKIAAIAQIPESEIDDSQPLSNFGLDSLASVELIAEVENLMKVKLSPTLPWDYPTISTLSHYLASLVSKSA